jgi:hypothetical protein
MFTFYRLIQFKIFSTVKIVYSEELSDILLSLFYFPASNLKAFKSPTSVVNNLLSWFSIIIQVSVLYKKPGVVIVLQNLISFPPLYCSSVIYLHHKWFSFSEPYPELSFQLLALSCSTVRLPKPVLISLTWPETVVLTCCSSGWLLGYRHCICNDRVHKDSIDSPLM